MKITKVTVNADENGAYACAETDGEQGFGVRAEPQGLTVNDNAIFAMERLIGLMREATEGASE